MLKLDTPELFQRHVDLERQIELSASIFLAGISAG
jgi:hypothetical protein